MNWIPIEMVPFKTFVLIGAVGETPTVAMKVGVDAYELAETGGYAEDSDPSFLPTHFMAIPAYEF